MYNLIENQTRKDIPQNITHVLPPPIFTSLFHILAWMYNLADNPTKKVMPQYIRIKYQIVFSCENIENNPLPPPLGPHYICCFKNCILCGCLIFQIYQAVT